MAKLIILGTAQDGGAPQAGCNRSCCLRRWKGKEPAKRPVCLGLVEKGAKKRWIIEATPAFPQQLRELDEYFPISLAPPGLAGIVLTHAHVGHYAGLLFLDKAIIGSYRLPVWVMAEMRAFLERNQPWANLVKNENIVLKDLAAKDEVALSKNIRIRPFEVPHRTSLSETIGLEIRGNWKKILFVPDVDAWTDWEEPVEEKIKKADLALLDGTFFDEAELGWREMNLVSHPTIKESLARFGHLPKKERVKINFIHLNHTNPLLKKDAPVLAKILAKGFRVGQEGKVISF